MVDVLLNTDDVVVLGPPETIDVQVDIGPTGQRGSQVFVGSGDPNVVDIGQTPIYNDLYINTNPGTDYSYMYQYISQPGGDAWVEILSINPAIYSSIATATFTTGSASVTIPVANIVTVTGSPLTASNFNIQYSIEGTDAIASAVAIPALVSPGTNLVLNFKAISYNGSTWANLTGSKKIHLFISIV
jgi:hypothetical protein